MKIKLFYLTFISLIMFSCSSTKYFEGTITYRFERNLLDENNQADLSFNEYSKREFGEYFIEHHKNGNYFRDYKGNDSIGLDFQLYIKNKNIIYTKYNYNDTLYWENTTSREGASNFKVLTHAKSDTTINNEKLNLLITEYQMPYKGNVFLINEKFFYNKNLKINPNDFAQYKKYFLYETFREMKSLPYLYIKKATSNGFSETLVESIQLIDKKENNINLKPYLKIIENKPLKKK